MALSSLRKYSTCTRRLHGVRTTIALYIQALCFPKRKTAYFASLYTMFWEHLSNCCGKVGNDESVKKRGVLRRRRQTLTDQLLTNPTLQICCVYRKEVATYKHLVNQPQKLRKREFLRGYNYSNTYMPG